VLLQRLREEEDVKAGLEKKEKGKGVEGAAPAPDAKREKKVEDAEMSEAHVSNEVVLGPLVFEIV
jgi:hypothetical protein